MDFISQHNPPIDVSLKNESLWVSFYRAETEMIITKAGRRMFPSFDIYVKNLEPDAHYCIALEFHLTNQCRFKYSPTGGWTPAGTEEAQSIHRIYLHPDSPSFGEYWMRQSISFNKLKLTNNPSPTSGQIVLSSMHKYQPVIIIAKTIDPRAMRWSAISTHTFKETGFIAVTAYQNETITRLKINNNPFAKGFREHGHSKTKKRKLEDTDLMKQPVTKLTHVQNKKTCLESLKNASSPACDSLLATKMLSTSHPLFTSNQCPKTYDVCNTSYFNSYYFPFNYQRAYGMNLTKLQMKYVDENNNESKTKTFTNFTIDAILNN